MASTLAGLNAAFMGPCQQGLSAIPICLSIRDYCLEKLAKNPCWDLETDPVGRVKILNSLK